MLNMDFSQRIVVDSLALPWQASPSPLVWRRQLERAGGECARATSIVRYDPGARFPEHGHEFGEEIIVLDGVFSDQHGDHGPGTYIKNPPGSQHAPFSVEGCTLFVKLRHLDPADRGRLVINFRHEKWYAGMVAGLSVLPLSEFATQHTAMVRWAPETYFNPHRHYGNFRGRGHLRRRIRRIPGRHLAAQSAPEHAQTFQPHRLSHLRQDRPPARCRHFRSTVENELGGACRW